MFKKLGNHIKEKKEAKKKEKEKDKDKDKDKEKGKFREFAGDLKDAIKPPKRMLFVIILFKVL